MSDGEEGAENFLQRWSRRKQIAQTGPRADSAIAETTPSSDNGAPSQPDLPAFDPGSLPPIESIAAASDVRAFLAPGVPEELTRAALRRAWVTDPTIRDFIGLAENQWDFTNPDGVPGFGSLKPTPELRRILARLVGDPTQPPPADARSTPVAEASAKLPPQDVPTAVDEADVAPAPAETPPMVQSRNKDAAVQTDYAETAAAPVPRHRRHGGALPK